MAPQDGYIEDDDDLCPLCIEELDLSDRNFRPCPCGYQICQFCFNNIKNHVNNMCPACRRPYNEKNIQFKVFTPEEAAEFRAKIRENQKKRAAEQRQREAQKREAERDSRKHLVGVRVVQKNLVYVTGLTPTIREDELLKTLRRPEFFGQYGNIQKISISNRKTSDGQNQTLGLGIYVTFERKEDAAKCIQAVNGSQNGDRVLRAQLGTTKYCSAWLRHEQCTNRQCMFLHELGNEEDSYTRQDLSLMNSISTQVGAQRPSANAGSSRSTSRQQIHHPHAQQHAAAGGPPAPNMMRSGSNNGSDNGDGSALPSSANWARNPQVRSRRGSYATSGGAAPSPAISHVLPAPAETPREDSRDSHSTTPGPAVVESEAQQPLVERPKRNLHDATMSSIMRAFENLIMAFPDLAEGEGFPSLFDPNGWQKRRAMRDAEETAAQLEEPLEAREPSEGEPESSGSLALGGEPEDRDHRSRDNRGFDMLRAGQAAIQRGSTDAMFGPALSATFGQPSTSLGAIGRTITPQQQQSALLRPQGAFSDHLPPGISAQTNLFQGQVQGHNRSGSRFSFANDNRDATATTVKLAANPRIMAQQSSMMPSSFHTQGSAGNQYYSSSSMPGPPPGLKSTGTPPSMFGQHGFSSFGGASKDTNEIMQLLSRGRPVGSQAHDSGKLDLADPSILQARIQQQQQQQQQQGNAGVGQGLFGAQSQDDELVLDEALTTRIEALVSDDPVGKPVRPSSRFANLLRPITPVVPPGLGVGTWPSASPVTSLPPTPAVDRGRLTPTPQLSVALPLIPLSAKTTAGLPTGLFGRKSVPTGPSARTTDAKRNIQSLAAQSGLSNDIAHQSSRSKAHFLDDADFPALDTPKAGPHGPSTPTASQRVGTSKSSNKKPAVVAPAAAPKALFASPTPLNGIERAGDTDQSKEAGKEKANGKTTGVPASSEVASPAKPLLRTSSKKPMPGLLNIAAATKAAQIKSAGAPSATDKSATSTSEKDLAFPALPTPAASSVSSSFPRAPKTLRLVSTPKVDMSPASMGPGGIPGFSSTPAVLRSAVASMRPETPISEMVSDSASILSTSGVSLSRTASPTPTMQPPPGTSKVSSAPVRTATKSQLRKQRKEALKKDTAAVVASAQTQAPGEGEKEQAPIVQRKKKQKKEKEREKDKANAIPSKDATPTDSRAQTPPVSASASSTPSVAHQSERPQQNRSADAVPVSSKPGGFSTKDDSLKKPLAKGSAGKEAGKDDISMYRSTANETTTLSVDRLSARIGRTNAKGKGKDTGGRNQPSASAGAPKPMPTPASTLRGLQAAGMAPQYLDDLPFLKLYSDYKLRHDNGTSGSSTNGSPAHGGTSNGGAKDHDGGAFSPAAKDFMAPAKTILTEDDVKFLLMGQPVRKTVDSGRVLITPSGDYIRNLTPEQEDRFLQLQQDVANANPATAFVYKRDEPGAIGFSLIKGRAVPNGPPSYLLPPQGVPGGDEAASGVMKDPVAKIQREEAIHYINQYVLPRLNLNMGSVNFPGSWKSTTSDGRPDGRPDARATTENAKDFMPWMFTRDRSGMAGPSFDGTSAEYVDDLGEMITDAAAPELNYPGPVEAFATSCAAADVMLGTAAMLNQQAGDDDIERYDGEISHPANLASMFDRTAGILVDQAERVMQVAGSNTLLDAAISSPKGLNPHAAAAAAHAAAKAFASAATSIAAVGRKAALTVAVANEGTGDTNDTVSNDNTISMNSRDSLYPPSATSSRNAVAGSSSSRRMTSCNHGASSAGAAVGRLADNVGGPNESQHDQLIASAGMGSCPFGSVPMMSLEDAEQALAYQRKETEKLEKTLLQYMKKNRRLLSMGNTNVGGGSSSTTPTTAEPSFAAAGPSSLEVQS